MVIEKDINYLCPDETKPVYYVNDDVNVKRLKKVKNLKPGTRTKNLIPGWFLVSAMKFRFSVYLYLL